ncbi:MAG: cysteine desulfurase family protein, partial [Actinomycetota bacterium]|nr:cysteine desulfurase family protein [Actinomycetota bacterium]
MTTPHPVLVDRPVYLDYNGTTPIDPAVVEAMAPYLSVEFGNPSSTHDYGVRASDALAQACEQVSSLVSGRGGRVVFTGSGSEADALAIRGAALAAIDAGRSRAHVVTQVTEHPAVLAACRYLEQRHAVSVTYLGVDAHGRVDPDELGAALTQDTVLASIMHANNETGTLQPVAEIAAITRDHGVLLHCDAAQSIGKVEVDVDALGVDLLTIVGHKMYAPKGIAALHVREGIALVPLAGGGGQESGLRAGTENVPYIVGFGAAAKLAAEALSRGESRRLVTLRDRMHVELEAGLPGRVHLNGHPGERL